MYLKAKKKIKTNKMIKTYHQSKYQYYTENTDKQKKYKIKNKYKK